MRPLFLTNNCELGSTSRILQNWLLLGRARGMEGRVALQKAGPLAEWLEKNAIPHYRSSMPWPDRWRPLPSIWYALRLARWARQERVDVIHCNEHDVYPFALMLRQLLRIPLVCHVRFAIRREFSQWAFGSPRRSPDALLWTSEQQRDDCISAVTGIVPDSRQHIVRLGVDLKAFQHRADKRTAARAAWNVTSEQIVLGTASAIRPIKRIDEFIQLVERLARQYPNVVGLIAGSPPPGDEGYLEQLLHQMKATGLGSRLRWLKQIDPIEPFYQACDIFVSTSEYETFGNSVCEAMACQRPVAAYRGGSVHEVVGDAGCIVETGDLDGLCEVVAKLIVDPRLRQTLGARARQRVELEFNPEQSLQQVLEIHQQLREQVHAAGRV